MKACIIIPARYGSSRYRGKPLAKILGREMVLRVADICSNVVNKKNLFIATDSKKISNVIKKAHYNVLMTSSRCLTGTDRVAEASKKLKSNIFVNVQGDEPTINPNDIKKIINAKIKFPNYVICGYDKVHKFEEATNSNVIKVVVNEKKELIYMSRSLIPGSKKKVIEYEYLKQVCIYAFNKNELSKFCLKNKKSQTESMEDIEILRFFDVGVKIKMIKLNSNSVAVDELKDIKKAERLIKIKNKKNEH